jgi:hypothetical protein
MIARASRHGTKRVVVCLGFGAVAALAGCNVPTANTTFTEAVPDRTSFPDVAQSMIAHCGTIDCHGTQYRNLRLYGNQGLRWLATDQTLNPPCTTSAEVDQDFDSVVGLEPEAMTAVVIGNGANPNLLTMVRKARGIEAHKGGTVMKVGDALDSCITSWLAGSTQTAECQDAGPPTVPPPAAGHPAVCQPGP